MHDYAHPLPVRFTDPAPRPPAHHPTYDAVVADHGFDPLGDRNVNRQHK